MDTPLEAVIENRDSEPIYEVPLQMHEEGLDEIVVRQLGLKTEECDLSEWKALINRIKTRSHRVTIGLVGKYIILKGDAYMSVAEALNHGGFENDCKWRFSGYRPRMWKKKGRKNC